MQTYRARPIALVRRLREAGVEVVDDGFPPGYERVYVTGPFREPPRADGKKGPVMTAMIESEPRGLGGWLILVAIGLVLTAVRAFRVRCSCDLYGRPVAILTTRGVRPITRSGRLCCCSK